MMKVHIMKRSKVISMLHPMVEAIEFVALALAFLVLAVALGSVLLLSGHLFTGFSK
jgi:hypothetical protein